MHFLEDRQGQKNEKNVRHQQVMQTAQKSNSQRLKLKTKQSFHLQLGNEMPLHQEVEEVPPEEAPLEDDQQSINEDDGEESAHGDGGDEFESADSQTNDDDDDNPPAQPAPAPELRRSTRGNQGVPPRYLQDYVSRKVESN